MIKIKHFGLIVLASSALLFSGCVQTRDTFYNDSYQRVHGKQNAPSVNVRLTAYAYPYYYDRPYYYLNDMYYYGGVYRNGFYRYGQRVFREGHYYARGYRHYRGNRYIAVNNRYGYYPNRHYYRNTRQYKRAKARSLQKGRTYESRQRYRGQKRGRTETKNTHKRSQSMMNSSMKVVKDVHRKARKRP
jgi:hypothetical protein